MRKADIRRSGCAARELLVGATLIALIAALTGCGNADLGSVSGKVSLDGQPLPGAQVSFMPSKGGGPSFGETDGEGNYTLTHTSGSSGAVLGSHTVSIVVEEEGEYDDSGSDEQGRLRITKDKPGKVPARYNEQTELTADVKAGENTFDFSLKSSP